MIVWAFGVKPHMSDITSRNLQDYRIAVILVNWNGWEDTIECLDALLACIKPSMHVFVVDNGSTDGSPEHILKWLAKPQPNADWKNFEGVSRITQTVPAKPVPVNVLGVDGEKIKTSRGAMVTLVYAGDNLGFAAGNNVGLRLALKKNFDWFWILNTDTVVRYDALSELLQYARLNPKFGIIGSTLIYYYKPERVQVMGGGRLNLCTTTISHIGEGVAVDNIPIDGKLVEYEMAYVVGASMLVSRQFIQQIGLMQDDYFLYFEEIDWAFRGKPKFLLGYAPRSWVFHKVGGSSTKVVSDFSLNLLYRNKLRFVSRFMPQKLFATKIALFAELARHILKGRWRSAKLIFRALSDSGQLIKSAPPFRK